MPIYTDTKNMTNTKSGTPTITFNSKLNGISNCSIYGNGQQDSGMTTAQQKSVTIINTESGTNYAMFLKSDFPDIALDDKVNIIVMGTTYSLTVKKIDTQYVYIENEVV
jgi:hypothetical protein